MVVKELIAVYRYIQHLKNKIEDRLNRIDNNLKREETLFNRHCIYPIFAHNKEPEKYEIYEPHLRSEFYFAIRYFKNIGSDSYICNKEFINFSIFDKVQIIYNLITNKIVDKVRCKNVDFVFAYEYMDIPFLKQKIIDSIQNEYTDSVRIFIMNAGMLREIIKDLIVKYEKEDCLNIPKSILALYKNLLKRTHIYLESYFCSDFWHVKNEYKLYLSFDIVIADYEIDSDKKQIIYDTIEYGINCIANYFTQNKIKKEFRNIRFVQAIKSYIETEEENVSIIKSIFSVKNFADLILADIVYDHISYI